MGQVRRAVLNVLKIPFRVFSSICPDKLLSAIENEITFVHQQSIPSSRYTNKLLGSEVGFLLKDGEARKG